MKIEEYELQIDSYLMNEMATSAKEKFEKLLEQNKQLATEVAFRQTIIDVINWKIQIQKFRKKMDSTLSNDEI